MYLRRCLMELSRDIIAKLLMPEALSGLRRAEQALTAETAALSPSLRSQRVSIEDMSKSVTIPRFLLPQLSWKVSKAPAVSPSHAQVQRPFSSNITQRCSSSTVPAWHGENPTLAFRRYSRLRRADTPSSYREVASRGFATAQRHHRDHHFDTLKFVQRLKDEGFSEEQSKAMMLVLSDVIEESIQNLTRTMVLREGTPAHAH